MEKIVDYQHELSEMTGWAAVAGKPVSIADLTTLLAKVFGDIESRLRRMERAASARQGNNANDKTSDRKNEGDDG